MSRVGFRLLLFCLTELFGNDENEHGGGTSTPGEVTWI